MNKEKSTKLYDTPQVEIVELYPEGVLCASGEVADQDDMNI